MGFVYLRVQLAREEWREWRLIRAAKAMELAEGVTLLEGVQACFSSDVFWFVSDDAVDVITGPYSCLFGRMRVYPDTGRIDVYMFRRDLTPNCKNEPEAMLDAMVQAARNKATYQL